MSTLRPDVWYFDPDTGQHFKVLKIEKQTVDVVDEHGQRRMLSRFTCEEAFKPAVDFPPKPKTGRRR